MLHGLSVFWLWEGHDTAGGSDAKIQLATAQNVAHIQPLDDITHLFSHKQWQIKNYLAVLEPASPYNAVGKSHIVAGKAHTIAGKAHTIEGELETIDEASASPAVFIRESEAQPPDVPESLPGAFYPIAELQSLTFPSFFIPLRDALAARDESLQSPVHGQAT